MPSPAKATNLAKRRLQKVLTKSKKRKRNWAEPCESDILHRSRGIRLGEEMYENKH